MAQDELDKALANDPTGSKRRAALVYLDIAKTMTETARELYPNGAPTGVMYAAMQGAVSFHFFNELVQLAVSMGEVELKHHCLFYIPLEERERRANNGIQTTGQVNDSHGTSAA